MKHKNIQRSSTFPKIHKKLWSPSQKVRMCSGGKCSGNSQNQCCADLLKLYCRIYEVYLQCPPTQTNITLQCFQDLLRAVIQPIFSRLQCGRVFCCEGYVEAIFCAFQTAISSLSSLLDPPNPADIQAIMMGLLTTLNAIVAQTGFIGTISMPTTCTFS